MKGATLVALALAAVFAVAVGEDKAYMSSSVTDGYFKRPTTGAFAKSVVVADENGELDVTHHKYPHLCLLTLIHPLKKLTFKAYFISFHFS